METAGDSVNPAGEPVQVQQIIIQEGGTSFGPFPKATKCPHCGQHITTTIQPKSGLLSWSLCALLCCLGCIFGCCLIPFCIKSTQNVEHSCPNCKKQLGAYYRCGNC